MGFSISSEGEFNPTHSVKDTWTPENPSASLPRYVWADQLNTKNFDRPSSMFFVPLDYLAIREVTLSYSLPLSLIKKTQNVSFKLECNWSKLRVYYT